jgi:hypothetical protein
MSATMNPPRHAEGEVQREATRILRKLAQSGARLIRSGEGYVLTRPENGKGTNGKNRKPLRVPASLLDAFRRRDWVAEAKDGADSFVLSDAGEGWIRRALADEDGFAAQHRIGAKRQIAAGGGSAIVTVNEGESPLGWLHRRKGQDGRPLIDDRQFKAGERLRADFEMAQLSPRMAVDLTAPVVAGRRGAKTDAPLPEIVLAAKQRLSRALTAVGPGLSDVLLAVCCHLIGLEEAERQKGWPQRSAKIVLQIALDRLAGHYGDACAVGTGSRLRGWIAEDAGKEIAREP